MIYQSVSLDEPLRQGDIFVRLPRVDISLRQIDVLGELTIERRTWSDLESSSDPVCFAASARAVTAIVATQNCDAVRAPDITLCEIRPFAHVEGKASSANSPNSWMRIITQHARQNLKWFYLPPDPMCSIPEKMAVDFMATLRLPRVDLEEYRRLRVARLNDHAYCHFRERLANFFQRYPYDEWYPLDADELARYREQYPDAMPYPWQNGR